MVATTNLPGSVHFSYFVGTKQECQNWLDEQVAKDTYPQNLYPLLIKSNKSWKNAKYLDGSKIIPSL